MSFRAMFFGGDGPSLAWDYTTGPDGVPFLQAGQVNPSINAVDGNAGDIYQLLASPYGFWVKADTGENTNWNQIGAGAGTVTSVGLSGPSGLFTFSNAVTAAGTLSFTEKKQSALTVWAGPSAAGPDDYPAFRQLGLGDLPGGIGTVSSVGLVMDTTGGNNIQFLFDVSGSPVTGSGDITLTNKLQFSNMVWAGPTTIGPPNYGYPSFRALVPLDLPKVTTCKYEGSASTITGTPGLVVYTTAVWDHIPIYSGGSATLDQDGTYQISATLAVSATFVALDTVELQLKQGANVVTNTVAYAQATQTDVTVSINTLIYGTAGDVIQILAASSGTTPVITASITQNQFSLIWVGPLNA